jgi:hypothetical protein
VDYSFTDGRDDYADIDERAYGYLSTVPVRRVVGFVLRRLRGAKVRREAGRDRRAVTECSHNSFE